jgi:hypothetical protein
MQSIAMLSPVAAWDKLVFPETKQNYDRLSNPEEGHHPVTIEDDRSRVQG